MKHKVSGGNPADVYMSDTFYLIIMLKELTEEIRKIENSNSSDCVRAAV